MSNLVITFTLFHTLAAITIFGFMIVSVVAAVQRKNQQ
jgi:hypothetical protein